MTLALTVVGVAAMLVAACGKPYSVSGENAPDPPAAETGSDARWHAQQLRMVSSAEPLAEETAFELLHVCDNGASIYILSAGESTELAVIPRDRLPAGHPCRARGP